MPENATIIKMLGLSETYFDRRFFYGDAFVVRLGEKDQNLYQEQGYTMFEDVLEGLTKSDLPKQMFRTLWDDRTPKTMMKEDREARKCPRSSRETRQLRWSECMYA